MSREALTGKLIASKYRLGRALGEGGMGVVYEATHQDLGHKVAVKILRTDIPAVPNAAERLLREARASVQLQSRHVAKVTDVGTSEDGLAFMVIELLEGRDLADVIEERGCVPYSQAVTWMLQVCDAVAEAHSLGVVHRDLKPGNLFLARGRGGEDTIKVLDFGISKALFGEDGLLSDSNLTETQTIVGTPLYASPEQLRSSKSVDARTDIWSLGVILFELITGCLPFQAETVSGLIAHIAADPAKKVSEFKANIPEQLERVIDRALTKDRAARYGTVAEFAEALAPFAEPGFESLVERIQRITGPRLPQSAIATMVDELIAPSTEEAVSRTVPPSVQRKRWALVGLLLLGFSLIAGGVFMSRESGPRSGRSGAEALNSARLAEPDAARGAATPADAERGTQGVASDAGKLVEQAAKEGDGSDGSSEPAGPKIRLTIATEPKNARLILDGAELLSNPFDAELPADGSMHRLEVRAYGYYGLARTLVFDRDLDLQFELRRQKSKTEPESDPAPDPPPQQPKPKPQPQPAPSGPDIYEDNPYW